MSDSGEFTAAVAGARVELVNYIIALLVFQCVKFFLSARALCYTRMARLFVLAIVGCLALAAVTSGTYSYARRDQMVIDRPLSSDQRFRCQV